MNTQGPGLCGLLKCARIPGPGCLTSRRVKARAEINLRPGIRVTGSHESEARMG